jgi:hypothetical protein
LISIIVDESNTIYSSQDGVLYNKTKTVLIEYPGGKSGGFTIPSSVTSIGDWAFANCYSLTSVTIPDTVTSIGDWAFAYCYNLTSMTIPSSVTSIGDSVFEHCSGLTSIVVDAGNAVYSSQDGVLYNKAKTVLIQYPGGKAGGFTIPSSVTSIGDSSFRASSRLTSVIIPNSVTSIGSYAFVECSALTSVTIPDSVTKIWSFAFNNCRTLTRVYFNGNAPSMGSYVFGGYAVNFSICYIAGATGFTTPTWYGYPASVCGETLIALSSFTATPKNKEVILEWKTESEIDNAGFNLYRSESENGEYEKINTSLIPAQGSSTQGAAYEFVDKDVKNRKTYYYKLEDIDFNGTSTMHGPVNATPRLLFRFFKKRVASHE